MNTHYWKHCARLLQNCAVVLMLDSGHIYYGARIAVSAPPCKSLDLLLVMGFLAFQYNSLAVDDCILLLVHLRSSSRKMASRLIFWRRTR